MVDLCDSVISTHCTSKRSFLQPPPLSRETKLALRSFAKKQRLQWVKEKTIDPSCCSLGCQVQSVRQQMEELEQHLQQLAGDRRD